MRRTRIARVTPEELRQKLQAGGNVVVVDLRGAAEKSVDAVKLPGALQMSPDELQRRYTEIPADRDLVLYCSCPSEAAAASLAIQLRQRGLTRVRPLLGGLDGWRARGYPLEPIQQTPANVALASS